MSVLIALGHKAQRGKDTVAKYLVTEYGFKSMAFAEPLKKMVAAAFPGVTMDHLHTEQLKMKPVDFWPHESPARMCQRIAQGVRSEYGQDFWAQILKRRLEVDGFFAPAALARPRYVITDLRTPAEAMLIKEWGGKCVRVDRDEKLVGDIGRPSNHWTEIALDDYDGWDAVITNNGTLPELQEKVDDALHAVGVLSEVFDAR